jgi:predicted lipoprotein with Yx(FWY)xxD motif
MKGTLVAAATLASLALTPAACGDDEGGSAGSTTSPAGKPVSATAPAAHRGKAVKVASSRYGRILVDGRGHTLYLFTRELSKRSRCYGACAKAWPPLYTRGKPRAGSGARANLLGTTQRSNGRSQVTYKGHPLYYYVGEDEPGEILCQNVEEFGGDWLIVSPRGSAIR